MRARENTRALQKHQVISIVFIDFRGGRESLFPSASKHQVMLRAFNDFRMRAREHTRALQNTKYYQLISMIPGVAGDHCSRRLQNTKYYQCVSMLSGCAHARTLARSKNIKYYQLFLMISGVAGNRCFRPLENTK